MIQIVHKGSTDSPRLVSLLLRSWPEVYSLVGVSVCLSILIMSQKKNCLNLQQDVIGQSLYELTHADDEETIAENLKPKGKPCSYTIHYTVYLTMSPFNL